MAGPASLTYASLVTDIKTYLERYSDTRLADQIPRLVMYAENRIATDLRILGTRGVATTTFNANNPVLAKPAYWRKTVDFNYTDALGVRRPLFLRSYAFLREFWPNPATATATPRYYSDYNFDNFFIAGTPNAALNLEIRYVERLPPLSDDTQVNWLTANAPQALLTACLYEAEIWLKNAQRIEQRKTEYATAKDALKLEDMERAVDNSGIIV